MSYFDWKHLTKPFQFEPVIEDTLTDRKIDTVFKPVSPVETNLVLLKIPAINFTPYISHTGATNPIPIVPLIIGQYNFSVSTPITIINTKDILLDKLSGILAYVAICVRWRVGITVYRYLLSKTLGTITAGQIPYPGYINQKILGNFVIEFWQIYEVQTGISVGIEQDFYFKTGIIYFPQDWGDTNILTPVKSVDFNDLKTVIPLNNPSPVNEPQNIDGPWLTN